MRDNPRAVRVPRWMRDSRDDFLLWLDDIFIRQAARRRLQSDHEQRLVEDHSYSLHHRYGPPLTSEWEPSPEDELREIEKLREERRYLGKIFRWSPGSKRD